jgi:hypothetical protein
MNPIKLSRLTRNGLNFIGFFNGVFMVKIKRKRAMYIDWIIKKHKGSHPKKIHGTFEEAIKELRRLCSLNPNETYFLYELVCCGKIRKGKEEHGVTVREIITKSTGEKIGGKLFKTENIVSENNNEIK